MTAGQLKLSYSMKSYTTTPELSIGFLDFMLMLAKNPFNHVGMTQKLPYIPILVGLGPKLWSVTLKLCQRAYSSVPFFFGGQANCWAPKKPIFGGFCPPPHGAWHFIHPWFGSQKTPGNTIPYRHTPQSHLITTCRLKRGNTEIIKNMSTPVTILA